MAASIMDAFATISIFSCANDASRAAFLEANIKFYLIVAQSCSLRSNPVDFNLRINVFCKFNSYFYRDPD